MKLFPLFFSRKDKARLRKSLLEMARIRKAQRKFDQAIENYKKAISYEPTNLPALREMAQVYADLGQNNLAERHFKEAITLGEDDAITYYNLATVQVDLEKYGEALSNAEKAYRLKPSDARVLYTYGLTLEKNGRKSEAYDYYTQAAATNKNYAKPRINLGRMYLMRVPGEAEDNLWQPIGLSPIILK